MEAVTLSQVQQLVERLPTEKLPDAYRLLRALEDRPEPASQVQFMKLPLSERRRLLAEQASQVSSYYQQTAQEREQWQAGDIRDDYQPG